MMNLFKKIKYFFLSLKEKNLQQKLKNHLKNSYTSGGKKHAFNAAAQLTLNAQANVELDKIKSNVKDIIVGINCDPEKLLDYVRASKTKVYKIKYANKILNLILEEEGLIYEKEGFEALYLSLVTGQGFKLKTAPMFILREGNIEPLYMLHHFYRWYSLKSGLEGFDYKSQRLFKNYLLDSSDNFVKRLSMDKIIQLQEAISRDQEATEFVLEYAKNKEGSQKAFSKMTTDDGASV